MDGGWRLWDRGRSIEQSVDWERGRGCRRGGAPRFTAEDGGAGMRKVEWSGIY